MKRALTIVLASVGMATAVPASATVVGGIQFADIGGGTHIETATLAETYVDAPGQTLSGYGYVTTVNGDSSYCASSPCSLYYYFTDYTVKAFNGTEVTFTGGTIDMYYSSLSPINLLGQSSADNVLAIQGMTPWVQFTGHTFYDPTFNLGGSFDGLQTLDGHGQLTGTSLSENGAGLADVNTDGTFGLGYVADYLNGNSEGDGLGGFADVTITASSNNSVLNSFDDISTCRTGQPTPGAWCLQGTLNTRGQTVPEPGTLALMGLALFGLFGAGGLRRRWS